MNNRNNRNQNNIFVFLLIIVLVIIASVFMYVYFFKNQATEIKTTPNLIDETELNIAPKCNNSILDNDKEVFNINNNIYTYSEAQNVCKSLDGELATLSQVIDAYKKGASWCNYGWIDGQMAVYPTQQSDYDKIQKSEFKNRCGIPGVNGGYFKQKTYRFGATCFAKKPQKPPGGTENDLLKFQKTMRKNLKKQYIHSGDIKVLPFNSDKWNQ